MALRGNISRLHTTYIYIYTYTHTHTHTHEYTCTHINTNTYSAYTERKRLRSFSRPVSSFVTLPRLFSDFLSSANNLFFRPAKGRHGKHDESEKKTEKKAKAYRVYLITPQMWYTANYHRSWRRGILSRARYSAVKEKKCLRWYILNIYYIFVRQSKYIYMRNNGSQLIGWRESFEFYPCKLELGDFLGSYAEIYKCNFVEFLSYFFFKLWIKLDFYAFAFDSL